MLAAVTVAFMLHGLTLGIAEGFRQSAQTQQAIVPPSILVAAVAISSLGLTMILLLVANAMAHSVRVRRYEFGVLMALGFTPRRILALLGAEAAVPCLVGAVLGLLGAKVLFAALAALLPALAPVPAPVYTPLMIGAALVIALLIATARHGVHGVADHAARRRDGIAGRDSESRTATQINSRRSHRRGQSINRCTRRSGIRCGFRPPGSGKRSSPHASVCRPCLSVGRVVC